VRGLVHRPDGQLVLVDTPGLHRPRTACRVVCGLEEVMAILAPTSALVSVDLPALGRPTKQANPDR
jgi:GTPase Era involved in 16S rRNA processing